MRRKDRSQAAASVVLATLVFSCCFLSAPAHASSGELDRSFGDQGLAFTSLDIANRTGEVEILSAPDGSAVLGDYGGMIRFRSDGSRDPGFGERGRVSLGGALANGGLKQRAFVPRMAAADSHGRLLVFGEQTDSRRSFFVTSPTPASSAVVLRFTREGKPDRSFGQGKGFVRADFGLGSGLEGTEIPMVGALAGRADSADRPVLVAGVSTVVGGCYGKAATRFVPRAVVRLTPSGQPDRSFGGGDGVSLIDGSTQFPSLAIDGADRLLVSVGREAGPAPGCESGTTLLRLGEKGGLLDRFGTEGSLAVTGYSLAVFESSGAMILSRRNNRSIGVVKLRPDGSRATSFGEGGVANVALPSPRRSHMRPVAVDAKGRILIAGLNSASPPGYPKRRLKQSAFIVARLLADGRLDTSFGDHGRILTSFARPLQLTSARATLDPQGHLLLAGRITNPGNEVGGFVLARYLLGP